MVLSFILLLLLTVSGLSLTYLFAEDEPLLWRLGAGSVVGSAVFGLVCFFLCNGCRTVKKYSNANN